MASSRINNSGPLRIAPAQTQPLPLAALLDLNTNRFWTLAGAIANAALFVDARARKAEAHYIAVNTRRNPRPTLRTKVAQADVTGEESQLSATDHKAKTCLAAQLE